MERITDPTHVPDLFGAGKPGFTDGDPLVGLLHTFLNARWFNMVQEELARLVEALAITLDTTGANRVQVLQAMRRLAAGNVAVRNASAALTPDDAGVVLVSAAAGNIVLTLPEADAAGGVPMRFTFVRTDGSGNSVTVQRAATDLIEGVASFTVPISGRITIVGNGGDAWMVQSSVVPPPTPYGAPLFVPGTYGVLQLSGNRPGDPAVYLQWGVAGGGDDVPGAGSSFPAVSFPMAFPNVCFQAVGTLVDGGAGAGVLVSSNFDRFGVSFTVSEYATAVQSFGVRYHAIGY